MKRIVTLLLAAGLMLGASSAAQAVDIKMSGQWDFGMQMGDYTLDSNSKSNGKTKSHNAFYQRLRTQIDIIASEALSGVVMFEIGDTVWGRSNGNGAGRGTGGGLGADGVSIEVKRAYLDWIVPQTDLKVRVGLQGFSNPSFYGGYQMFDDDVAGITLNYQFNPTVGVSAWFLRPFAENSDSNYSSNGGLAHRATDMDLFGFSVPLVFDGVKVTPWMTYASIGRNAFDGYTGGSTGSRAYSQILPRWAGTNMGRASDSTGSGWWGGLTGEVTLWNPFRFAWDFNYGSVDMGKDRVNNYDLQREGWIVSAIAEYKLDFATPGLFFWYGSGDDDNVKNGSEMMPSVKASSKYTTFGFDNAGLDFEGCAIQSTAAGTWGIGLQLAQMSFVQDLKHTIRVSYMNGTNSEKMTAHKNPAHGLMSSPFAGDNAGGLYLTEKDSAWELNLDSTYDIYKNLQLGVELGYIRLDLSDSAWGKAITDREEDGYKIGVGLRYSF